MLKLGALLVLLLAAAGAAAWLPLHGRTMLDRWNAARGPADFVARGWAEAKASLSASDGGKHLARQQTARGPRASARPGQPSRPVEQHTEADRAALDRIIAEHAAR